MFISKHSWVLFGFGAFGLMGCGGADWSEAAEEGDTADLGAELSEATASAPIRVLSLGDSIAFGFNPLVAPVPVTNYVGYPEVLASAHRRKVTNASCPGETSSSFFDANAQDNGCKQFKAAAALHADYETTQSVFMVSQIQNAPATNRYNRITLNIGANDLFLLQAFCTTDPNPLACIQARLPSVIGTYAENLKKGFTQAKGANFSGKFVGVATYAVDYNDQLSVQALTLLNTALKTFTESTEVKGKFVDIFALFQGLAAKKGGSACAAGLLIKKPDGTCDIHPSKLGREKIAAAVNGAL